MNTRFLGIILGIFVLGGLAFFLSRHQGAATPPSSKVQVAASFYPLAFFAREIGGDKADVMNITPAGGEPHDYEPTAQDVARIENAKLLILNGGGLEAWGDKIKQNIDQKKTLIVTAGEGLTTQKVVEQGQAFTGCYDESFFLIDVL